jgi:chromosome segregation ATPase
MSRTNPMNFDDPTHVIFNKEREDALNQRIRVLEHEKATLRSQNNVLTDKLEKALDHMKDMEARWMTGKGRIEELEKNLSAAHRKIDFADRVVVELEKELFEARGGKK